MPHIKHLHRSVSKHAVAVEAQYSIDLMQRHTRKECLREYE